MKDAQLKEDPADEKPVPVKTARWQTITVVAVLSVFVLIGIIFTEWRNIIFSKTAAPNSIAVLPFENVNQDGYAGNIADNLSDSILSEIAQNPTFPVVPRNDILRYRGKNEDPGRAGKALKAKMVVTGRVLREGENLTIKAELIEVESRAQLWSKQYNVPIAEVMKLPPEISREILAAANDHK